MGPRLHQIDELNKLGLTPEDEAALLGLPLKTVREYQYRIRQIDGIRWPRGNPGFAAQEAERERMRQVLINYETGRIAKEQLPPDAYKFYGRIRTIDEAKKEGQMPKQTRGTEATNGDVVGAIIKEHMAERRGELQQETGDLVAFSAPEAAAALNYWRGRAEEYNALRTSVVERHPELAKDLPPALEVDEISVRQVTLAHEREQDKSLQIAR